MRTPRTPRIARSWRRERTRPLRTRTSTSTESAASFLRRCCRRDCGTFSTGIAPNFLRPVGERGRSALRWSSLPLRIAVYCGSGGLHQNFTILPSIPPLLNPRPRPRPTGTRPAERPAGGPVGRAVRGWVAGRSAGPPGRRCGRAGRRSGGGRAGVRTRRGRRASATRAEPAAEPRAGSVRRGGGRMERARDPRGPARDRSAGFDRVSVFRGQDDPRTGQGGPEARSPRRASPRLSSRCASPAASERSRPVGPAAAPRWPSFLSLRADRSHI